ncbi:hypothetical protein [Ekhidna sp.]|jgi:hypothetical protein|uniref:hypothetical protein n=1 Tax=Ekhidna sp. TaxID=2608089 RepID=UPI0032EDF33D
MRKQFRILFASLFLIGILASCGQDEVDTLNIDDLNSNTEEGIGNDTGGGHGGDDKET